MSTMSSLRSFAHRIADGHRRRATTRAIEKLPAHIQKDIGWLTDDMLAGRKSR